MATRKQKWFSFFTKRHGNWSSERKKIQNKIDRFFLDKSSAKQIFRLHQNKKDGVVIRYTFASTQESWHASPSNQPNVTMTKKCADADHAILHTPGYADDIFKWKESFPIVPVTFDCLLIFSFSTWNPTLPPSFFPHSTIHACASARIWLLFYAIFMRYFLAVVCLEVISFPFVVKTLRNK